MHWKSRLRICFVSFGFAFVVFSTAIQSSHILTSIVVFVVRPTKRLVVHSGVLPERLQLQAYCCHCCDSAFPKPFTQGGSPPTPPPPPPHTHTHTHTFQQLKAVFPKWPALHFFTNELIPDDKKSIQNMRFAKCLMHFQPSRGLKSQNFLGDGAGHVPVPPSCFKSLTSSS